MGRRVYKIPHKASRRSRERMMPLLTTYIRGAQTFGTEDPLLGALGIRAFHLRQLHRQLGMILSPLSSFEPAENLRKHVGRARRWARRQGLLELGHLLEMIEHERGDGYSVADLKAGRVHFRIGELFDELATEIAIMEASLDERIDSLRG